VLAAVVGLALLAPTPAPLWGADYVIQISVDGLRPSYLQTQINAGLAPNFKRLQDEGAWTNNARTDYTHTNTLPNHTSMLTGRPVSLPAGLPDMTQHGYTQNDTPPLSETLHNYTNPDWYKASVFDVASDAGLSTALYASKGKFIIYDQSYNQMTGELLVPDGQDEINTFFAPASTLTMQNALLAQLSTNPADYTFVHYADLDDAGHNDDWGSPQYMTAITAVDGYLGQLLNQVQSNPALANRTAIVLTADHGGTGGGHGNVTNMFNYTIPFYVWGAGVQHGSLYDMNLASRKEPGTSRPSYTDVGQPIRNGDSGNLSLDLLGLSPIPGSLINSAHNLRVTHTSDYYPGDFNFDNRVNSADYVKWRKEFGVNYTQSDFNTWRSRFGQVDSNGSGSGASGNNAVNLPSGNDVLTDRLTTAHPHVVFNAGRPHPDQIVGNRSIPTPNPPPIVSATPPPTTILEPSPSRGAPISPSASLPPPGSPRIVVSAVPEPANLFLLSVWAIIWIAARGRAAR
jgi:predicted AlkP superfamily pyrophosphatase or phosphodiesterase